MDDVFEIFDWVVYNDIGKMAMALCDPAHSELQISDGVQKRQPDISDDRMSFGSQTSLFGM